MAKITTLYTQNFADIFSSLVDYQNFKEYLRCMLSSNDDMKKHQLLRILKDPLMNCGTNIFTCK